MLNFTQAATQANSKFSFNESGAFAFKLCFECTTPCRILTAESDLASTMSGEVLNACMWTSGAFTASSSFSGSVIFGSTRSILVEVPGEAPPKESVWEAAGDRLGVLTADVTRDSEGVTGCEGTAVEAESAPVGESALSMERQRRIAGLKAGLTVFAFAAIGKRPSNCRLPSKPMSAIVTFSQGLGERAASGETLLASAKCRRLQTRSMSAPRPLSGMLQRASVRVCCTGWEARLPLSSTLPQSLPPLAK